MSAELPAAIKAHLDEYMQGDNPQRPIEALERVLEECDRCERGGTMMAPDVVRNLIADTLRVTAPPAPVPTHLECPDCHSREIPTIDTPLGPQVWLHQVMGGPCSGIYQYAVRVPD